MPQEPLITTKISRASLRLLRLIAAATDETQYAAMDRVLTAEAARLGVRAPRARKPRQAAE